MAESQSADPSSANPRSTRRRGSRRFRTIAVVATASLVAGTLTLMAVRTNDPDSNDVGGGDNESLSLELRALVARSLDGTGHPTNDNLGAIGSTYLRTLAARYADGKSQPVTHPPERRISNRIFDDLGHNIHSARGITHWGYAWGQFILHDLTQRRAGDERAPLAFDPDDPLERFSNDLGEIDFTRSAAGPPDANGARTQINELSSYLDGSVVYGTTAEQLDWLRAGPLDGDPTNNSPYLLNDGVLLPSASQRPGTPAPDLELTGRVAAHPETAFVAGDRRVNENWALTSLHTLFVREHNRIVAALPDDLIPEARFQIARRVVIAELQFVTYHEYLPTIGVSLPDYEGFDSHADPTITDEFATAGFRMHSQVHGELRLTDTYGGLSADAVAALAAEGIEPVRGESGTEVFVPLDVAFGNPTLLREIGIDAVLQALSWDVGYANDETIDDALRSVLFELPAPGADPSACHTARVEPDCYRGVLDLAAIDIARGFDHGLPTYNDMREAYGLGRVESFAALTGEPTEELPPGVGIDDPAVVAITAEYDRDGVPLEDVDPRSSAVTDIERTSTTAARLRALYGDIDELDLFTGLQVERRAADSELGELQQAIWTAQFVAIRNADPWFSDGDPLLDEIENEYGIDYRRTLDDIVRDNANTLLQVPPNLFVRRR